MGRDKLMHVKLGAGQVSKSIGSRARHRINLSFHFISFTSGLVSVVTITL
mgnify:CR=1 FL=1